MPGWDGYPVRDALSRELGSPVLLDNDVNVMALGEQHTGVARSASDFLFVKIGTGIGCGIVVDRHLYRGADGCAGDIGHIRVEQTRPGLRVRQPAAASRRSSVARRWPATRRPRPGRAAPACWPSCSSEHGELTAAARRSGDRPGRRRRAAS